MHAFGCRVLLPAAVVLVLTAWKSSGNVSVIIVEGALAGIVAAVAYDLYRLPFVLGGVPLFSVFSKFGELLLNGSGPRWLVELTGWSYHFSNGVALGIMFLAMVASRRPSVLLWGAVGWAVLVEAILLLTPYPSFLGLKLDGRFLFLTASAHVIFGVVLGLWLRARLGTKLASRTDPLPDKEEAPRSD